MKLGGIFPEQRAARLKEIAALVKHTFAGDLRTVLKRPLPEARKALKQFPTIGDPGADKILLFTKTAPVATIPSNCVYVLPRLGFGEEKKNYAASYRSVQEEARAQLPEKAGALLRAYLLIKQHGQELCKRSRPRCEQTAVQRLLQKGEQPDNRAVAAQSIHEGFVGHPLELASGHDVAAGQHIDQEDADHVFLGINPETGSRRASPIVFAL
jgi:endonuclease III